MKMHTTALTMAVLVLASIGGMAGAATLHVPKDHKTIQAAIDAAAPGDTIVVAPGTYRETVKFKERVTLKSAGDDTKGAVGLKRAEVTIIEGEGEKAKGPAVLLAEGAVLDGFTVTKVGLFDQKEYDKHYATNGVHVPDTHNIVGYQGNFPAVAVHGVTAVVKNNVIHDNDHAGIGCMAGPGKRNASWVVGNVVYRTMGAGIASAEGATPLIEKNRCSNNLRAGIGSRKAAPIVIGNECFDNVREGIGAREGATSIIRGNKCYKNRQVGISSRHEGTVPLIEDNDCYENAMGGIGCREGAAPQIRDNRCQANGQAGIRYAEGASPTIRGNQCERNKGAGIEGRAGGRALIAHNQCAHNEAAGIELAGDTEAIVGGNHVHHNKGAGVLLADCKSAQATLQNNKLIDAGSTALRIGSGWKITAVGNEVVRKDGTDVLITVAKGAEGHFSENTIRSSGGIGLRVEGLARLAGNVLECLPPTETKATSCALQIAPGAEVVIVGNTINGWLQAVFAEKASVIVSLNKVARYGKLAIEIIEPRDTVTAIGNIFESEQELSGIKVAGGRALLEGNRVEKPRAARP